MENCGRLFLTAWRKHATTAIPFVHRRRESCRPDWQDKLGFAERIFFARACEDGCCAVICLGIHDHLNSDWEQRKEYSRFHKSQRYNRACLKDSIKCDKSMCLVRGTCIALLRWDKGYWVALRLLSSERGRCVDSFHIEPKCWSHLIQT